MVQATAVAGLHVGILVLSRDLGSAVIFFAAYLVMIYVATKKPVYLGIGLAGGGVGVRDRLSPVRACAPACQRLEKSHGGISE